MRGSGDMLRLPDGLINDKKSNDIVEKYINKRIYSIVKDVIFEYAFNGIDDIRMDDKGFIEFVSVYFPPHYPKCKMGETFFGLYALLEAEDKFVPELVMEYIIASLIESFIAVADGLGLSTVERIETDREYVLSKLMEESEDGQAELGEGMAGASAMAKARLNAIENIREYEDIYFWDTDYELLNTYTEEALRTSVLNTELGIGLKSKDSVFVIPKEWYQS